MGQDRKLFLTEYCITPLEKIPSCGILCEAEKIIGIGGSTAFTLMDKGMELFDLSKCYAVPGLIDSHVHGIGPYDASCPDENTLRRMGEELVKHGVTTFCPTVASQPKDKLLKTVEMLATQIKRKNLLADVNGIHLEGPFINKAKRGSQDADAICDKIDIGLARELMHAGGGRLKYCTFAPELDGAEKLVELMLLHGVIPSMGHSLANEEQTLRCIDAGAHRCTYVFNGMPQLYHREASLTSVALTDDRVSVEMICDGVHIHPRFVDLTTRCKPHDKIIGISNGVAVGTGQEQVREERDGQLVTTADGVISGTTMTLENSWRHLISYAGMSQTLAAACFTRNPAIDIGLYQRGELTPGKLADITFFDSKTHRVRMTVIHGKVVYDAKAAERN